MNYFRCTVGGSGKGNTVTVTCAEEFAGLTITLSKTGKTYTKTCPSTSPYVVTFYSVENGTYTVSATYGGRTYSESVVVKNIDCVLNYGFGWVTWVNTAQYLDASDYASLDEVLEDEAAIRELFLEHACVDYMAEAPASNIALQTIINNDLCAKWINLSDYALDFLHANEVIADLMDEADKYFYGEWALMPQVPTMTSATAPYGEVIQKSSYTAELDAWHIFASSGSYASAVNDSVGAYVGYKATSPFVLGRVYHKAYQSNERFSSYIIQGSNDGINWSDLSEVITIEANEEKITDLPSNKTAYLYHRIYQTVSTGGNVNINSGCLQFYAWQPKGNVPVMTGDTAPYGTVTASSVFTNYTRWKAFNGTNSNASDCWHSGASSGVQWIKFKFPNPVCVRRMYMEDRNGTVSGKTYTAKLQGSNDDTNYTDIAEFTYTTVTAARRTINAPNNNDYYLYYRVYYPTTPDYVTIGVLQFYGRELKVSVPKMTSNTAPYGTVTGSSVESTNYYYKAFDNSTSTFWGASSGNAGAYVAYEFPSKFTITMAITIPRLWTDSGAGNYYDTSVKFQGYDDAIDEWTDLTDTITLRYCVKASGNQIRYAHEFTKNIGAYKKYRLYFLNGGLSAWPTTSELQFYGLDYSEKEFEVGTTKKWLYDHGVKLSITGFDTIGDAGTVVEDGHKLEVKKTNASSSANVYIFGISKELVDLTPYSHLFTRCDVIEGKQDGTNAPLIATAKTASYNLGNSIVASNFILNGGPLIHISTSAINQNAYVGFGVGYNQSLTDTKVYELWLE